VNILDAIINAQDGAAVRQIGSHLGLGQDETAAALSALVPALAAGVQRNVQNEGGLGSLISALSSGHHPPLQLWVAREGASWPCSLPCSTRTATGRSWTTRRR
jgi:hypothetical protein